MTDTDMELRLDRAIREHGWCRACHHLRPSCVCPENQEPEEEDSECVTGFSTS